MKKQILNLIDRESLYTSARELLGNYCLPTPALLHGDLWSGNAAFDKDGNRVIFDPAVYYGDTEADIAFTKMFGGYRQQAEQTIRSLIA